MNPLGLWRVAQNKKKQDYTCELKECNHIGAMIDAIGGL